MPFLPFSDDTLRELFLAIPGRGPREAFDVHAADERVREIIGVQSWATIHEGAKSAWLERYRVLSNAA